MTPEEDPEADSRYVGTWRVRSQSSSGGDGAYRVSQNKKSSCGFAMFFVKRDRSTLDLYCLIILKFFI